MANVPKTVGARPTTALDTVYTCPVGKTAYVMLARATNTTAASASITVKWTDASSANTAYAIVNNLMIPANASVRYIEDRLVLEAGDMLQAQAGTAGSIDLIFSVIES